jgi:hypothetical protein
LKHVGSRASPDTSARARPSGTSKWGVRAGKLFDLTPGGFSRTLRAVIQRHRGVASPSVGGIGTCRSKTKLSFVSIVIRNSRIQPKIRLSTRSVVSRMSRSVAATAVRKESSRVATGAVRDQASASHTTSSALSAGPSTAGTVSAASDGKRQGRTHLPWHTVAAPASIPLGPGWAVKCCAEG